MVDRAIGPGRAVRFDSAEGTPLARRDGEHVVVGVRAFDALARGLDDRARGEVGSALGRALGRRVADRLGSQRAAAAAAVDVVGSALRAELVASGFGKVTLERWGRALVVAIERPALEDARVSASLVGAAIEATAGRAVACEPLAREKIRVVTLVASARAASRARAWLADGMRWVDVVARLHARDGGAT